ncbi:hypothetical protein BDV98DRAFT_272729 [Pterulicium gracile]|uniref:Uncharacterized protein n=1 Tax=Pterulicium gracile TaxID=1884261 RepID=A0A5C3Q9W0_9AGAR|nr:hypothetical protein BDV98DRAFT_272729 [Pterula gracilis]
MRWHNADPIRIEGIPIYVISELRSHPRQLYNKLEQSRTKAKYHPSQNDIYQTNTPTKPNHTYTTGYPETRLKS